MTYVRNDVPENTPSPTGFHPAAPITSETVAGNVVAIRLGDGRYAFYAHLQPSIPVRVGDRVTRGQVVGRLGNSGNSRGPHLRFQLSDDPTSLNGDEGVPFVFERFEWLGRANPEWRLSTAVATPMTGRFPLEAAVIRFP